MNSRPNRYRPPMKVWEKTRPAAQAMRKSPTAAEAVLWERLRNRKLAGYRFRRQHPIDRFVVDFCCPSVRLVVEVDGGIHDTLRDADEARERLLNELGFKVLRFTNDQVLQRTDWVLEQIHGALRQMESA
jgi:very-short-patch-repair endonuclease